MSSGNCGPSPRTAKFAVTGNQQWNQRFAGAVRVEIIHSEGDHAIERWVTTSDGARAILQVTDQHGWHRVVMPDGHTRHVTCFAKLSCGETFQTSWGQFS